MKGRFRAFKPQILTMAIRVALCFQYDSDDGP
jgi:hypothetical protein